MKESVVFMERRLHRRPKYITGHAGLQGEAVALIDLTLFTVFLNHSQVIIT